MASGNTWTRITDSDGGGGLGLTTDGEKEQAEFMDRHAAQMCECGVSFEYRPTCGVMQCPICGEIDWDAPC